MLIVGLRCVLGGMLLLMGILKIRAGKQWLSKIVASYQIVGRGFSDIVASVLPIVEVVLGLSLLLGLYPRLSAWLVYLLVSFFTYLLLYVLYKRIVVNDCGCFGKRYSSRLSWSTVQRNLVILLMVIGLYMIDVMERDIYALSVGQIIMLVHWCGLVGFSLFLRGSQV